MDEFQVEYIRKLNKKTRRFKLEENYFKTACTYLELLKQIFHSDERDNRERIQNDLENILVDIVKIDQDFEIIVQENKNKLTRFFDIFYKIPKHKQGKVQIR